MYARYELVVRAGQRLLGLHHLNAVRHPGCETLARTVQILVRQINIAAGDVYLLSRRTEIQECGSDIIINLAANVFCFRLALPQGRFRLRDVTFNSAAREDGNADSRLHIEGWVQVGEGGGKLGVTAIDREYGITFAPGCGKRLLGAFHKPDGRL